MSGPYNNEPYQPSRPLYETPSTPSYPTGPGYGTPPGYGGYQQPQPQPYYVQPVMVAAPSTNGMAIASLICAFFIPILGVIFGHIALGQIKRSNGMETGHGLAVAGLVISYVYIAIGLIFFLFWIVIIIAAAGAAATS